MDYEAIEKALVLKSRNVYETFARENPRLKLPKEATKKDRIAFKASADEWDRRLNEAKGRVGEMLSKVRRHRSLMVDRAQAKAMRDQQLESLRLLGIAIKEGKRVLAFDVERSWPNAQGFSETREIGYTTFQNGELKSFNLRSSETAKSNWIGFQFGDSVRMPVREMCERIFAEADKADFYVGHSLKVDLEHLRDLMPTLGLPLLPWKPIIDTFHLSSLVPHFEEGRVGANLAAMADHFGVDATAPHNGGNDARYNMEVVLAMVEAYGTY